MTTGFLLDIGGLAGRLLRHRPRPVFPLSGSNQRCACCGAANRVLALGERTWSCSGCGAVLDREGSAADDLRRLGLEAVDDGPVPDDPGAWER